MTAAPAGQHTVRRHNVQLVLAALAEGSASRAVLAQRTGLTKSTVSSLVDSLIGQRVLTEDDPTGDGPGRPSRPLRLNPDEFLAVGLEINVDYLAAAALDLTGQVRRSERLDVDNTTVGAAELVTSAATLARQLCHGLPQLILGVGVAVPGVVDAQNSLRRVPNLPQLAGHDVAGVLSRELDGATVRVANEANCAALAELRERGRAALHGGNFVFVSGDVGVGAGIVVSGSLFPGVHGFAGELGHVTVERSGPSCPCGGQGCVERYAGLPALLSTAKAADLDELMHLLGAGDEVAVAAARAAGSALGVGVASMLNMLDLPVVVLGGIYGSLYPYVEAGLAAELDRRVLSSAGCTVLRTVAGAEAAVRGAAGLMIDEALSDPAAHRPHDLSARA